MSELMPTGVPIFEKEDVEQQKHPDYDLIAEKLLISRGTTIEQFKSPNVYRAAEHLYAALYDPDSIDNLITPSDKFPDRIAVLKKQLTNAPLEIPSKEEFIEKMRHAMVSEVEFGKCFSEEAQHQFRGVMGKSEHTVIWTDGDAEGVPGHDLPGSKEQLKKLAAAQFYNKARREIAQERDVKHTDVLSVVAIEGKMKFIPVIVEKFVEKGIKKIIIIEDRVKNLVQAIDLIKKTNSEMEIFSVWIRVGQWKNKIEEGRTLEEWSAEFHVIGEISQLGQVLNENNVFKEGVKVGSIFDLDGPLHDDDIRKKLQTEAVIKVLMEKGWI